MGGSEDPDRDLSSVSHENLLQLHNRGVCPQPSMDGVLMMVVTIIMVGRSGSLGRISHCELWGVEPGCW